VTYSPRSFGLRDRLACSAGLVRAAGRAWTIAAAADVMVSYFAHEARPLADGSPALAATLFHRAREAPRTAGGHHTDRAELDATLAADYHELGLRLRTVATFYRMVEHVPGSHAYAVLLCARVPLTAGIADHFGMIALDVTALLRGIERRAGTA